MRLGPRQRRLLIGAALALTLSAAAWVDRAGPGDPVALPAERATAAAGRPNRADERPRDAAPRLALDKLSRSAMTVGDANPFASTSWYVAPAPPPVAVAPPPRPTAPPLPFRVVGMMEQGDGAWSVQIARGNEFFTAVAGDTVDNVYRVEGIENGQLVLRYLPLSIRQTLLLPVAE